MSRLVCKSRSKSLNMIFQEQKGGRDLLYSELKYILDRHGELNFYSKRWVLNLLRHKMDAEYEKVVKGVKNEK